ncbi:MAG: rhomboid family intramembrane serine protease [Chthoniobacterales bacterium]
MTVLDKLERRIGFLAIPGLVRIVVTFNALVFGLVLLNPGFDDYLGLDPGRILAGEVWRLVTYIFVPPIAHFLWVAMALWFLWFVGVGLERAWGAFRITLFYLVGMIGTTVAAFFFGSNFSSGMLNASLFFAFARFYPEEIIYVFFVLPLKIKWLAWIGAAFLLLGFLVGTNSYRMALLAAFSNYFIFFGPEIYRDFRHRKDVGTRRRRFEVQTRNEDEPLHRCSTCGATELSDVRLEFRVAKDGEEYCMAHLPSAAAATAPR